MFGSYWLFLLVVFREIREGHLSPSGVAPDRAKVCRGLAVFRFAEEYFPFCHHFCSLRSFRVRFEPQVDST